MALWRSNVGKGYFSDRIDATRKLIVIINPSLVFCFSLNADSLGASEDIFPFMQFRWRSEYCEFDSSLLVFKLSLVAPVYLC